MKKIILVLILSLGAFVRLVLLDQFPAGASGDEVQQGYTAYSILKTGRDEWGETLPLFPRSFGDYKPPVYVYLTIPSVALFDLNEFSTRLPSAVFGIITIFFVYLLTKELFKNEQIAIWASLLIAISPWHIQLSRTAFEGNIGVTFFTIGLWAYIKSKFNNRYLILAAVMWGLTLYTYHSFRVFTILFGLVLLLIDRKKINFKKLIFPSVILILSIAPLIFNLRYSAARASDVSIFKQANSGELNIRKFESGGPVVLAKVVNNKVSFIAENFANNYISYFSPAFFFTGNRSAGSYLNFPFTPLLYLIELIFLITFAIRTIPHFENRDKYIVAWLLLAPIPAAVSIGDGHLNRAVTFVPLFSIISAAGLVYLQQYIQTIKKLPLFYFRSLVLGVLLVGFLTFLYQYFFQLPYKTIDSIRTGYKQVFLEAIKREDQYQQIIFSHSFTEPQIFVAFYKKLDPQIVQEASIDWLRYEKEGKKYVDQLGSYSLGKYQIKDFSWNDDRLKDGLLLAGSPTEFPGSVKTVYEVRDRSGKVLLKLVDTKENKDKPI